MNIKFSQKAFNDYNDWTINNKKIFIKIQSLIKECLRTPYEGTGKPEPLKHDMSDFWSRRITQEHRLVYKVEGETLFIDSCKDHY
ncbi:toxin YoeB [Spirochaetia bacterium]|nr:toxin YoeB [Spirochaetia bacterium]